MFRLVTTFCLSLIFSQIVNCQEEELIIDPGQDNLASTLVFENPKGSVVITGYDGALVIVKASPRYKKIENNEIQDGLVRLPVHKISLSAVVNSAEIVFSCESDSRTVDLEILVPREFSLKVGTKDYGEIRITRVNGEIEADNPTGDISVENVRGPIVLTSISGNIKAQFHTINSDSPSMITSFHGNVDLFIPEDENLSFKLKSQKGEVLTDLDIRMDKRKPSVSSNGSSRIYQQEDWSTGHLNMGGSNFIISTYWGDIIIAANEL